MSKHTPGPWEAGPNPRGICSNEYVVRPAGEFPHGAWVADCGMGDDESIANAHLIAAAPEMLEALKSALGWMVQDSDDYRRVVAVIAKAENRKYENERNRK